MVLPFLPAGFTPRPFQENFYEIERQNTYMYNVFESPTTQKNIEVPLTFYIVACGGGKTLLGGMIAAGRLFRNEVDFVLVLTPNGLIQDQFIESLFEDLGIDFTDEFRYLQATQSQGLVTTYQWLAARDNLQTLLTFLKGKRVLVILDEVHHLGVYDDDHQIWTSSVNTLVYKLAHTKGTRVVSMTGTGFRSDKSLVKFIRTKKGEDGTIKDWPHESFSLADGIKLGFSRTPHFPTYDSNFKLTFRDVTTVKNFSSSDLCIAEQKAMLRGAVDPGSEAWKKMIDETADYYKHLKKNLITEFHPALLNLVQPKEAGVDLSESSLQKTYDRLVKRHNLKGYVISVNSVKMNMPESKALMKALRKGDPSIERPDFYVTNYMMGEGVSDPHIIVTSSLTNVTAEVYVYQALGRAWRRPLNKWRSEAARHAIHFMFGCPLMVKTTDAILLDLRRNINEESDPKQTKNGDGNGNGGDGNNPWKTPKDLTDFFRIEGISDTHLDKISSPMYKDLMRLVHEKHGQKGSEYILKQMKLDPHIQIDKLAIKCEAYFEGLSDGQASGKQDQPEGV